MSDLGCHIVAIHSTTMVFSCNCCSVKFVVGVNLSLICSTKISMSQLINCCSAGIELLIFFLL
jgi:hypothetical protein